MKLSFNDAKKHVATLGLLIKQSGFQPDYIVGLARGGWIPTRLLSDILDIKDILSAGVKYADAERSIFDFYSRPDPFPVDKKILLVEDCLESGKSLAYIYEAFHKRNPDTKTASLFITEKTIFVPDFYLEKLDSPPVFPWE